MMYDEKILVLRERKDDYFLKYIDNSNMENIYKNFMQALEKYSKNVWNFFR